MQCEEFLNHLNARFDGQLRAEDSAALDAHLAGCAKCRLTAEGLHAVDAELRRAFVGRREAAARVAESTVAKIRTSAGASVSISPAAPIAPLASAPISPRFTWGALVGLAAGFLLAVAVFRPWQPQSTEPDFLNPVEPVAHLAVASGPVEVWPARQIQSFTCPTGGAIERDSTVRTGPTARCEIALDDGNSLRLDCNTEVTLQKSKVVKVSRGRLSSTTKPGRSGFEIQSAGGRIVAKDAAQVAIDAMPQAARLVVVEGTVNVQTGKDSIDVGPGKQVRIVEGKIEGNPDWCDASLETAWVNSVLALRGSDHPELVERVNKLLANIGAAKLSFMYEDELRRLGDDGVPPLLAYLNSTRDKPTAAQRVTAARIVSDVAQSRWIADMIGLLTDANADVRFHAARGLERLTGRDQGCDAKAWQAGPWGACEDPYNKWLNWWTANRDRYPAARREIAAPKSPPF